MQKVARHSQQMGSTLIARFMRQKEATTFVLLVIIQVFNINQIVIVLKFLQIKQIRSNSTGDIK